MTCNKYNVGDFVRSYVSHKPAIIININTSRVLISIDEYFGDYVFVDICDIRPCYDIDNYERLSILAGFGKWFYDQHNELYQELLIDTLINDRLITG